MTEREWLYSEVLKRGVVTTNEVVNLLQDNRPSLSRKVINDVYISPLVQQNKLKRLRRGLYIGVPLEQRDLPGFHVDKFLVAGKIREQTSVIMFHSALEFYGCAENVFDEIFVGVRTYFEPFHFQELRFRPFILSKFDKGINRVLYKNNEIAITSKERTLLDCVKYPEYAGGWEECLKSLEGLSGLNFDFFIKYFKLYSQNQLLVRKVGYILELLKERSLYYQDLSDKHLEILESWLSPSRLYLNRKNHVTDWISIPRWHLYVPVNFEEYLRGV